jgi:hypothetical protein
MLYPAKASFYIFDAGANSTPTCTGYTIRGRNLDGQYVSVSRTVSMVENVVQTTTVAFQNITELTLNACNGHNTGDVVVLRADRWVGLPFPIDKASNLLSMCFYRQDSVNLPSGLLSYVTPGKKECVDLSKISGISSYLNLTSQTVNLLIPANWGMALSTSGSPRCIPDNTERVEIEYYTGPGRARH